MPGRGTLPAEGPCPADTDMLLLLLPLLWAGSLQQEPRIQLHLQESVSLQEGQCVLVPCAFSFPGTPWSGPLHVSWFWDQDNTFYDPPVATNKPDQPVKAETRGRFLLQDPTASNCSLLIRHARRSDAGTYRLRVEGKWKERYKNSAKTLELRVTALTEKPDIHFLGPLELGRPTNLTCSLPGSCEGAVSWTAPTFSWTGAALDPLGPRTHHSSVLTLTLRLQDHGTNLTCWVRPQGAQVATKRTVQLQVSYSPQNLTISICGNDTALKSQGNASSLSIPEGQALHLFCDADGNPPAQLSWFRGSPAPNASLISNSSHLELPGVHVGDGGELTCRAENALGSALVSLSLSVLYPPQLLGPSCSWEAKGLRCSCSTRAHPAPSLRWRLGEGLVEGNSSDASFTATASSAGPWASSNLSLSWGLVSDDLRLSCEARNALGAQSIAVLLLPGKLESRAGEFLGALGGAGTVIVVALCLCLIFICILKARRKPAAGRPEDVADEDPVMGSVAWGFRQDSWPESPPDQESPPCNAHPSGEDQNHPYEVLSFPRMTSQEPKDLKITCAMEYSEIS